MTLSDAQADRRPFDDVRRRDLHQSWTSPNDPDHRLDMPCSLPRWIGTGATSASSLSVRPSPLCRRVGIHDLLSRPAQASRGYSLSNCSPTWSGLCHEAPVQTVTCPNRPSATELSRLLLGWVLPPLVICAFGAHCIEFNAQETKQFQ